MAPRYPVTANHPAPRRRLEGTLGVFLKAPVPGRVKTRLAASWGGERAAALYRALARDTLEWATSLARREVILFYSPPASQAACADLLPRETAGGAVLEPQARGSLGRRLEAAFARLLGGSRRAVLVGTDCPLLSPPALRAALDLLNRRDLVLGPALDGGYYLVGLSRPVPELFRRIPWSTGGVLEKTLRRAAQLGLTWALLEPLGDVDTPADVAALRDALLGAWRQAARGEREHFPRHTFRELFWGLDLERDAPRRRALGP